MRARRLVKSACVYVHRTADTNDIFYVGIGKLKRARSRNSRSEFWQAVVAKHGLLVEIVMRSLPYEDAAKNEVDFIAFYGRRCDNSGCLVNLSLGGEHNRAGVSWNEEQRLKISERTKAAWANNEKRSKITAARHAVCATDKYRASIGAAARGRAVSEETRAKIAAAHRGKTISDQTRARLRNSHPGRPVLCVETAEHFPAMMDAVRWLRSIGHEKASAGSVMQSASSEGKQKAYGHTFQFVQ